MKAFLCFLLATILFPILAIAQKITIQDGKLNGILPVNESGKVFYQIVGTADSISKDELFKRARKWFVKNYNSANQVLQVNDPVTGELTGKGYFGISETIFTATHVYPIRHVLSVEVKPGKYRVTLSDFVVDDKGGIFYLESIPRMGKGWIDKFYTKINTEAVATLTSLQKALATSDDF